MKFTHALKVVAAVGTGAFTVVASAPAHAGGGHSSPAPIRTITTRLDGPFGLDVLSPHAALVAESESGEVTAVNLRTGARTTLISKLPGVAGVAADRGKIFAVLGGPNPEGPPPPPSKYPPASVLVADRNGKHVRVLADLLKYELKHNPDGQKQFDKAGKPYDALSNPFSLTATRWGLLVADGGANDVLRVDPRTGKVSTFFVPPNPRTKECLAKGAQANPGTKGCDSVPTGIAVQGRHVYVSTLGAEQPGAAAIYKLDGRTGRVLKKYGGFTSLTGVAVSPWGTLFASEVLFGAPAGPPQASDPSKVGRLTRIDGRRVTHAAVPTPTGIEFAGGKLYSTSGSIAGNFGVKHAGRLVQVNPSAFR
ncbi:ScyD/ScyE family protein [Paractinoplanes lichenicola]|uniref:ScyD/ScyE family protein n=1 Tax=Paractinoplanes lichenicola TaxID=2802976 RepID=A0ABS1VZH6_9ACTN|nr:ScyD/ScyE family protein [Actinoplanes lichenicola]MBL7259854.1 ScyD/ScyE family protein [Actinoplanes lichenicola]